jgi:type II secretory pathway pseudopilin PulG
MMRLKRPQGRADHESMASSVKAASFSERGYTLVELMVAATVLILGSLGAFSLLNGANRTTVSNNARMGATNLAREILETARSLDYDRLTDGQMDPALQAKVGIDGAPWKVKRRGIEYTVETSVCTFDDPKDNVAATPPVDVCTPQAPVSGAAPADLEPENQPDDFRRINVSLTWDIGRGATSMQQTTLVNNPSGGMGPRITKFEAPPDNLNQFSGTAISAQFPTETTFAASVRWNSDGSPTGQGDSTGGPKVWNTTWQLGAPVDPFDPTAATGPWPAQYSGTTVLDGTYTVTVQAFDDRGVAGDARAAVLPLNRSKPITVTGFELGRNDYQNAIEFQWEPNPERDIIGYEVLNAGPDNVLGNGNDTVMCSTASANATSCVLESPPAGTPTYYVVANDKTDIVNTASAPRRSDFAKVVTTPATAPAAPLPPTLLPIAIGPSGNPELDWLHLDLGSVRFFRIYRDSCCDVDDRYDATPGNSTHWVDPDPGTGSHTYWVTAVGPTFNESTPSSPAVAP